MKVQPISTPPFKKRTRKEIQEVIPPKYYCISCTRLHSLNICDCFQRHVDPNYNRCYFHSNYVSHPVRYRTPANLEQIIQEESKLKK